ncbi:hypothetical protein WI98_01155 [Burkholderia vietnamiensis]|nr:hypothetical protein WI98_01155 [Burkholderia vietnamiensis]
MLACVAAEVVEYLVVDYFAEDGAGRTACCAADEAGDHGTRYGTAHGTSRSGERANRCAGFCTGQGERDTAGCAGDCANGSACLACAIAGIDAIGLALRARRDQAWLGAGPGVVLLRMRWDKISLERFVILVLVQVHLVRVIRIVGMGIEARIRHGRSPPPAGSCRRIGVGQPT